MNKDILKELGLDNQVIVLEEFVSFLGQKGISVTKEDVTLIFKHWHDAGDGSFVIGRKGRKSRFVPTGVADIYDSSILTPKVEKKKNPLDEEESEDLQTSHLKLLGNNVQVLRNNKDNYYHKAEFEDCIWYKMIVENQSIEIRLPRTLYSKVVTIANELLETALLDLRSVNAKDINLE